MLSRLGLSARRPSFPYSPLLFFIPRITICKESIICVLPATVPHQAALRTRRIQVKGLNVTKPEGFRSLHRAFFPIHYLGVEHLYITCSLSLAEGSANGMQRSSNICIGIPSADPSSRYRTIFTSSREFHVLSEAGSIAAREQPSSG